MEVLHPRCAGLDIHKDSVVACVRIAEGARVVRHVQTFATTTTDLERLSAWLKSHGVTHVVMEATGVYWKPVWAVRGDGARARPGQRGPRQGCAGPQDGRERRDLARRSPRAWPDPPELRAARRRAGVARPHPHPQAVHPRAERPRPAHRQAAAGGQPQARVGPLRHHGSGRAVLDALASGESDPERLADQVRTKVRASRAALGEALRGRLGAHQRVVLRLHLAQADAIEAAVAELDREVGDRLAPVCDLVARLSTMPGLSSVSASAILSEIGSDMSRFSTPAHLVSWAGLCPRNDESAGRRRSTRLRHGAPWLKTLLVQAAWSAVRVKASSQSALFYRLRARRGAKTAIVAVAASMLTAIHVMLARGVAYRDLGADHFERTRSAWPPAS